MKSYIVLILLIAVTFTASLQNSFVWDDYLMIVDNPRINLSFKEMLLPFTTPLSKFAGFPEYQQVYYRPVLFIFFILNYKIWGMNPTGFHLVNILLHMIIVIVLYRIGLLLLRVKKQESNITPLFLKIQPNLIQAQQKLCSLKSKS